MSATMQRVLAVGGGGFLMEEGPSPIDAYIARSSGKERPRVCFVSTPSGDLPEMIDKFYETYERLGCDASHLAFFRRPIRNALPLADYERHLSTQDAVFVGGGNTKSALAVWREWRLDRALGAAGARGMLLSGMSAGALCWFESGLTDSYWGAGYRPLSCLGLLAGGCCVHFDGEPQRRERLREALRSGAVPATIGIDDGAAVLYENGVRAKVLAWRDGASAHLLARDGERVVETTLEAEWIGA